MRLGNKFIKASPIAEATNFHLKENRSCHNKKQLLKN